MNCQTQCLIATCFLVGSVYMSFIKNKDYEKTLNDKQKEQYAKVREERQRIFIRATMGGLLACLVLFMLFERGDNLTDSCFYASVFFLVQYFVYILTPKKYWMLQVIEDNEDAKQWLDKYSYMQRNWHTGLILGVFAFGFYAYYALNNIETTSSAIFISNNQPQSVRDVLQQLSSSSSPYKLGNTDSC